MKSTIRLAVVSCLSLSCRLACPLVWSGGGLASASSMTDLRSPVDCSSKTKSQPPMRSLPA